MRKETIPMDPDVSRRLERLVGAAEVVEELKKLPEAAKFVGFNLALATAEKVEAQLRSEYSIVSMRALSRAGLPAHLAKGMTASPDGKQLVVEIEDQESLL